MNPFRLLAAAVLVSCVLVAQPSPPKAGPVEILPLSSVTPGMKATAWTVFQGGVAEPIPVEILGIMENSWGPGEDIIMAKLGGKAERTNVAGGMSGSPVYHEGKLLGAISLRFSVFSPDSIAGITPIELMLEINELDTSRPMLAALPPKGSGSADSRSGQQLAFTEPGLEPDLAMEIWNAGKQPSESNSYMTPIETPLAFSGRPSRRSRCVWSLLPEIRNHGHAGRRRLGFGGQRHLRCTASRTGDRRRADRQARATCRRAEWGRSPITTASESWRLATPCFGWVRSTCRWRKRIS